MTTRWPMIPRGFTVAVGVDAAGALDSGDAAMEARDAPRRSGLKTGVMSNAAGPNPLVIGRVVAGMPDRSGTGLIIATVVTTVVRLADSVVRAGEPGRFGGGCRTVGGGRRSSTRNGRSTMLFLFSSLLRGRTFPSSVPPAAPWSSEGTDSVDSVGSP